jgi:hypothetical protein
MWFEGAIRDHLDVGRPDQIALIFHRRVNGRTPGRFRIRVINPGVDPILCCYYKSSRIKQYFKEGRALRTETVICDTGDFGVGRRVCAQNWNALRAVGESANRRLCDAEAADAQPAPDVATFCRVTRPSTNDDGLYAAALRFGEQRVMAILGRAGRLLLSDPRLHQSATRRARWCPSAVALHLSAGDLRSAPTEAQRAHRQSWTHQSLSADKPRPPGRRAFHQDLRPHSRSRIKRARSPSARTSHGRERSRYRLALFRESSRRLHAGGNGCPMNLIVL